jgi:FdhD protein
MSQQAVSRHEVIKVVNSNCNQAEDALAVEEPLEIRLEYGPSNARTTKSISVTMRTPGNDAELAQGFLFTEGIIKKHEDVASTNHCFITCADNKENVIQVSLAELVEPNLNNSERNFYTTSSCGVCGKASVNAIRTVSVFENEEMMLSHVEAKILYKLPELLHQHQDVFADTGGLHACALFDLKGELLLIREDVGRHNALDKLIGASLSESLLPLNKHILLLSGRASFELVQKAAMAGFQIIAAVGAPSSLALELAQEFKITLIGFLRGQRFNIYTGADRILIPTYENSH